jgi:hypothetical protein
MAYEFYYTVVPDMIHSPIRYKNTMYVTSRDAIAKCDIDDPISSQLPVVVTLQKKYRHIAVGWR